MLSKVLQRILRSIPVLLTLGLYVFIYYCYYSGIMLQFDLSLLEMVYMILGHIILVLSLVSFLACALTKPGESPKGFSLDAIPEWQAVRLQDNMIELDHAFGKVTYCEKCQQYRPHRSHHCKECNTCILRYDHHCLFVGNCVGIRTHKLFILFVSYTGLVAGLAGVHMSVYNAIYWFQSWELYTGSIVCVILTVVLSIFGCYHTSLVADNLTSLEYLWKRFNIFDRGCWYKNFVQVFGKNKCLWWIPVVSNENKGIIFPARIRTKTDEAIEINDKFII